MYSTSCTPLVLSNQVGDIDELRFFLDAEVFSDSGMGGVAGFSVFALSLFLLSYWNSKPGSEALVLVAIQIISYFCINPYLISLTDWRNYMTEEAEALMHSSISANKVSQHELKYRHFTLYDLFLCSS